MPNPKQFSEVGKQQSRQALNSLIDKGSRLQSFQSSVKLEAKNKIFEKRFNLALAADRGNKLRLELFPSNLASPALLAAVNRKQLTVIDRGQRTAWTGILSDQVVEKLTAIPLNSSQIYPWLSGSIPFRFFGDELESYSYMEEKSGNRSLLRLKDRKGFEYVLLLKRIYGRVDLYEVELSFNGKRKSYTKYFRKEGSGALEGLQVWLVEDGTEIKLSYTDLVVNPRWSEKTRSKLFSIKIPRTFQVRPADELIN